MNDHVDFYPLLIVTVLAVLVPILLHRIPKIRAPIVVGEILAGVIVGPNVLGLIGTEPNSWLDFLKLFGFAYLMFISGLEIDFSVLFGRAPASQKGRTQRLVGGPLRAAALSFGVTLALSAICALVLTSVGVAEDVVLMALILSTTSLGIVAPVLKERGMIRGPLGQYTLVAASVGDFVTVTLVSVYVIFHTEGLTFETLFVLVLLAVTFLAFRLAGISQRSPRVRRLFEELSHATAQLDTRGALALAVVFIALAQGLGVELILGAFMAGAIVSLLSEDEGSVLRTKLHALGYGFFIPVFFIMVGVDVELEALLNAPSGWLLVPLLVVMAYFVKYAGAVVYKPLFSWRETLAIGTLMSSRLSLIIAVAAIGVEMEVVSQAMNAAIVFIAVFTIVVSPVLFERIAPRSEETERAMIVIAGSTPHARLLAQRLQQNGDRVVILTANRHVLDEIESAGLSAVVAEPGEQADALERAGGESARALVTMLDDEEESLRLATLARDRFGVPNVVAHVKEPRMTERFKQRGIRTIDPSLSAVTMLEACVRHPHAFSIVADTDLERHMVDVRLRNRELEGRKLRTIRLPGDALLMLIVRGGEVIVPRGHTRLLRDDLLTLVGSEDSVRAARDELGA